jgi:glutathione gamma-glutamylcysteinyltransferase
MTTLHRRPLPEGLVPFEGEEGRQLLAEALAAGTAASFFPLVAQFHTQADPAWCGLGSLVTTLNALGVDPGRAWRGPWRHFDEQLLICCDAIRSAAEGGLTLTEVACVAVANGAEVHTFPADAGTLDAFRADLTRSATSAEGPFAVVNYARPVLGQTGSGHFSPVGAVHAARDLALILDVARFKYPPHWVPVERLWRAMHEVDPASGGPRGWLLVGRGSAPMVDGPRCPPACGGDATAAR